MKVGDYIRTKYGVIARITDILENCSIDCDIDVYYENGLKDYDMPMMEIPYDIKDEYITKSSPNIIDLIEVGDYVNGWQVIEHAHEKGRLFVPYVYVGGKGFTTYEDYSWELTEENEDRIETIETKEQFESRVYNVKR